MPLLAIALALVSAFAWSGLDATRKSLTRRVAPEPIVAVFGFGQAPLFLAWASQAGGVADPAGYLPVGAALVALNTVANLLFVLAVRVSPFSVTVPFLSFTPVFTAAFARPVLGEAPTALDLVGMGLVVAGALALNAARDDGVSPARLVRAFLRERGSVLMLLVAGIWSVTGVLDKLALAHATVPAHAAIQSTGVGTLVLLTLVARGRARELGRLRREGPLVVASILFAALALGFQLLAIQQTLVALVETLKRAVGNGMSAVLGRALFDEPITRRRVVALAVMAAGSALVMLR